MKHAAFQLSDILNTSNTATLSPKPPATEKGFKKSVTDVVRGFGLNEEELNLALSQASCVHSLSYF